MSMVKDIISGWSNYFSSTTEVEEMASERAKICDRCPHSVSGSFEKIMPDFSIKEVQGKRCDVCNCPLSTATRSVDYSCPLNKW